MWVLFLHKMFNLLFESFDISAFFFNISAAMRLQWKQIKLLYCDWNSHKFIALSVHVYCSYSVFGTVAISH